MKESLSQWTSGIIAAAALSAVAMFLVPEGNVKKVTRFVCGIVLCSVALLPVTRLDGEVMFSAFREYKDTVESITLGNEEAEKNLLRSYIEEKLSAYIWDEAQSLGIQPEEIDVSVRWNNGEWVPESVELITDAQDERLKKLLYTVESELGISRDHIQWGKSVE